MTGSTEPRFLEVPPPVGPRSGEVLCRTLQLGVCGTDRTILETAAPLTPPGDDYLILGHECLARVEAVGQGVEGLCRGDLVIPRVRRPLGPSARRVDLLPYDACTERGIAREHGFSTPFWVDRPEYLHKVPQAIEPVAVLAEPMSVAEKGINEATAAQAARLGEQAWRDAPPRVLVTGMGPIAFAAIVACRARHWPVVQMGREEATGFRAELAQALGAGYLQADALEKEPQEVEAEGFDLVLECTGSAQVMVDVAQLLASCGILVWLGSTRRPRPETLEVERLMRLGVIRNHLHIGSVNAAPRDFAHAIRDLQRLWDSHAGQLQSLITARIAPADALWHYRHRPPQSIKTVLVFE